MTTYNHAFTLAFEVGGCAAANARLIAAAPEMLAALEMVMRRGRIDDSEEAMNQVAAAIAKAKGGEA